MAVSPAVKSLAAHISNMDHQLEIRSIFGNYAVHQAASLQAALPLALGDGASNAWLIVDDALDQWHRETLAEYFAPTRIYRVAAAEEEKSFDRIEPVLKWLLESGFRRDCTLIAIGGGVVQDIAGFVASILFRGARWKLLPSTLLAQCDSCIGSKSSINIAHYKNQLGTFFPPRQVVVVPQFLRTLPRAAIFSGLGEIIKLHLVAGQNEFAALQQKLAACRFEASTPDEKTPDEETLALLQQMSWDSLLIKQRFIESDEFDTGVRNLLNYGHTFGHAYESATNYATPHGIAVTLGLASATRFSARLGWIENSEANALIQWLRPYFEPYQKEIASLDPETIIAAMKRDKKNTGQEISCILTRGAGAMEKKALPVEQTRQWLAAWLEELS